MSRRTSVAALFALVVAAAMFAFATGSADAHAAKKPVRPKVGQCRTTTYAGLFNASDSHKPVKCSTTHRLKTIAVVNVPKSINYKHINKKKLDAAALKICWPAFFKSLGSSHANQEQTAYSWAWFIPTKAERNAGARWLRCDLLMFVTPPGGYTQLAALPNLSFPFIGTRTITDKIRRCLSDPTNPYWTPCDHAHAARADQTFTIASKAWPTKATVKAQADAKCPGKRWTYPAQSAWTAGDHVVTCYSITTS